ncbi:MAG: aspartate kinase [Gammaproteobacteria bacterium]|nr:aspartate kinase [Gammaproteobacteria bacterium]NIM74971.1 aspartate kinase [Gammaproteobacteria bacterium]NIN39760.1 aspartate kinase [Gammaproteobacteria bacterium]NIO26888.1 aspartate kinase [Gammaproteobacteria bacterium]NIO67444.1 aspartate kinase [Gammaproteobacteria bacterium]
MALIVQKYGGTSVGDLDRIAHVARRVKATREAGNEVVVVLSAMGGETDRLLEMAHQISAHPARRELDVLLATGEQVSIALLCMSLANERCAARSFTGGQARIRTDTSHTRARIEEIDVNAISRALTAGEVAVVAGFQGIDQDGNITTLGRGGSDTTAVALAAALGAEECQIYTDVDGVYTSDPRVVPDARRMDTVTYEEMLELASLGAKVLQIRAVEFASKYNVTLRVLSSFEEGPGTLITSEDATMEKPLISGVAFNQDEAKLTVKGVPDRPGIAAALLGPIAEANIDIDMIVQNVSEDGTTDMTFTVHRRDYQAAFELLDRHARNLDAAAVTGDDRIAKISLVGVGMRSHAGIAARMFEALAAESINIQMISTSEIKISVVVDEKYLELGVRALHAAFGLAEQPPRNQAVKS